MSDADDIASQIIEAYQDFSESVPTISHDGEEVPIMPAPMMNDFAFNLGGESDAGKFQVCTAKIDWDTPPEGNDTVSIANHATADDGDYEVINRTPYEGFWVFTLGDITVK